MSEEERILQANRGFYAAFAAGDEAALGVHAVRDTPGVWDVARLPVGSHLVPPPRSSTRPGTASGRVRFIFEGSRPGSGYHAAITALPRDDPDLLRPRSARDVREPLSVR